MKCHIIDDHLVPKIGVEFAVLVWNGTQEPPTSGGLIGLPAGSKVPRIPNTREPSMTPAHLVARQASLS